ncbi:hypothetical protein AXW67_20865 [Bradyrhizobium neotropicale]|uniref:Uncharacterized protein n=1 Tax=Bradyrhizobium neotropicale TaxID=1497615 RepID=A0A176YWF5_9BRAD|nr:hypothetical protein AXW67_20865 [Bradyrhizobium neotropicale]
MAGADFARRGADPSLALVSNSARIDTKTTPTAAKISKRKGIEPDRLSSPHAVQPSARERVADRNKR